MNRGVSLRFFIFTFPFPFKYMKLLLINSFFLIWNLGFRNNFPLNFFFSEFEGLACGFFFEGRGA